MAVQQFLFASAVLLQVVFGQYLSQGSYVAGNSFVDNDIYLGNTGLNLGNSGLNVVNSGLNLVNPGLNLVNSGVNLVNPGLNLVNSGLNLGNAGLNLGNAGLNLGSGGIALASSGLSNVGFGSSYGLVSSGFNTGLAGSGIGGVTFNVEGLNVDSSGPIAVTTISPVGPSGLAVVSENVIEGNLLVSGTLPFLSAVAFEGALPSAGTGVATCGCGNGNIGIISEGLPQILPASGLGLGGPYY